MREVIYFFYSNHITYSMSGRWVRWETLWGETPRAHRGGFLFELTDLTWNKYFILFFNNNVWIQRWVWDEELNLKLGMRWIREFIHLIINQSDRKDRQKNRMINETVTSCRNVNRDHVFEHATFFRDALICINTVMKSTLPQIWWAIFFLKISRWNDRVQIL